MKRFYRLIQFSAQIAQLLCRPQIFLRMFNPSKLQSALQLFQNGTFICLVGMQLQAEGIQADSFQAVPNYRKRCHFLRDK